MNTRMKDCIFCKIVRGEIPAYKIYEDKDFLAFLDINPKVEGHFLIIPKIHLENIFSLPEELAKEMFVIIQRISKRLVESGASDGVDILNANGEAAQQSVFHLHFHIFPRKRNDGLDVAPHTGYPKPSEEKLKEISVRLRNVL